MGQPGTSESRLVVLTGATSGIGLEAARLLTEESFGSCHVVLACRNVDKASEISSHLSRPGTVLELDLSSMASVNEFYGSFIKKFGSNCALDILIMNAGHANFGAKQLVVTNDGHEYTYQVNFLAHMLLAQLLLPHLKRSSRGRIVFVASSLHDPDSRKRAKAPASIDNSSYRSDARPPQINVNPDDFELVKQDIFDGKRAYCNSKLAGIVYMYQLQRQLKAQGSHVQCHSVSPGFIPATDLSRHASLLGRCFLTVCLDCLCKPFLKITRTPYEGGLAVAKVAVGALPPPAPVPVFVRDKLDGEDPAGSGYYRLSQDNERLEALTSSDISYHGAKAEALFQYVQTELLKYM